MNASAPYLTKKNIKETCINLNLIAHAKNEIERCHKTKENELKQLREARERKERAAAWKFVLGDAEDDSARDKLACALLESKSIASQGICSENSCYQPCEEITQNGDYRDDIGDYDQLLGSDCCNFPVWTEK